MSDGMVVDFTGVESGRILVPPGVYDVVVTDVEERESKQTEFNYLNWELTIRDAASDYDGSKLWTNTSFSPRALGILKSALIAFGEDPEALEGPFDLDPYVYVGRACRARVTHKDLDGRPVAQVSGLEPASAAPARGVRGRSAPTPASTEESEPAETASRRARRPANW